MPGTALKPAQVKTAPSEVFEPLEHEIAVAMGLWVRMLVDNETPRLPASFDMTAR